MNYCGEMSSKKQVSTSYPAPIPLPACRAHILAKAEVIRDRLRQHKSKEFWISAIVFVSKDENLTKAHVRYLESRLLAEASEVRRFTLEQNQATGSKLPESDREDMEIFLSHMRQLLPVLGSDLLIPVSQPQAKQQGGGMLFCRMKGGRTWSSHARRIRRAQGFDGLIGGAPVDEEMAVCDGSS